MSTALLNLDTLVIRPVITIDKKRYDILSPDELPVLTSHLLASKGKRMEELMNKPELADDERDELRSIVCELSTTIMEPVPAEVRDRLTDPQRFAVIEVFSTLLLTNKAGTAAAMLRSLLPASPDEKAKPTGEKRSRASSASTAGSRAAGSRKRRSPS